MKVIAINTTNLETLTSLKGIGKILATRILENRVFFSEKDVLEVPGIGKKSLQKIIATNNISIDYTNESKESDKFHPFLEGEMLLRNDQAGLGHFKASRRNSNGSYEHRGIDILCIAGEKILSPIHGILTRQGRPYDKGPLRLMEIKGVNKDDGIIIKLFYSTVLQRDLIGKEVLRGQHVGTAQSVGQNNESMQDHIHLELRRTADNRLLDPTPYVFT